MGVHAVLSASSSHRWMNCSGSPALVKRLAESCEIDPNRTSVYAEEGTAAHALAEMCIREGVAPAGYTGEYMLADEHGDYRHVIEEPEKGLFFPITEEMVDGVQLYLDVIEETKRKYPHAIVLVEKGVYPLAGWEEEMFGTADVILWDLIESKLIVIDFKYGAGYVVEAEWNSQTMTYGLGALRLVGGDDPAAAVETVEMIIVQPRALHAEGPVRRFTMTGRELVEWGGILRSAGEATKKPDAPLRAGDHCKWCPAQPLCPAKRLEIVERAKMDFDIPPPEGEEATKKRLALMLPDPENAKQLGAAMDFLDLLQSWMKEVAGMAQARLERGQEVIGKDGPYKLVHKRSNRQWLSEAAVVTTLKEMGLTQDEIYTKKVRSPAQIEKIKKVGKDWVKERSIKPPGGLTVTKATDEREAVLIPAFTVPQLPETAGDVLDVPSEADRARAEAQVDNWLE
jgi:hypothetical protein